MFNFKQKIETFITFILLGISGTLSAYLHPQPHCWTLEGEFLYFYPAFDDNYFVLNSRVPSTSIPQGRIFTNELGFTPAFRVSGAYGLYSLGQDLRIDWTYLHAHHPLTVLGSRLFPTAEKVDNLTGSFNGAATSVLDTIYQNVEALFEQKILDRRLGEVYFQYGFEYVYIRLLEQLGYVGINNTVLPTYRGRTWGVGPEVGLDSQWFLNFCEKWIPGTFSVVAGSKASLLVCSSRSYISVGRPSLLYFYNDRNTWRVMPAWFLKFGLNYLTCYCSRLIAVELGYEFAFFNRAISKIRPVDNFDSGNTFNNYQNFSLQGPYLSVSTSF